MPKKYGKVLFNRGGPESAVLQRKLTEELIMANIIQVSRLKVEKWFEEDKKSLIGCVHNIVLHDKREEDAFRRIMEGDEFASSPIVKWKICLMKDDKEFLKWAEEVTEEIRSEEAKEDKEYEEMRKDVN